MIYNSNKRFVNKVVRNASKFREFEDSESSMTNDEDNAGKMMVVNISLGKMGVKLLHCMDNDAPDKAVEAFCKKYKLGPSTKQKVMAIVVKKQKEFNRFSGGYV